MTDNQNESPDQIVNSETEKPSVPPEEQVEAKPDTMEVHHPHHVTHKKKWTEYLLEFFMLFLAVFLGFVAENLREHQVERSKEKEYIEALINDLKYDTLQFSRTANALREKVIFYDSVFAFFKNPSHHNYYLPYKFLGKTAIEQFYSPAEATLNQLKSSGSLRLIHDRAVLDSILNYDSQITGTYKNQTEYEVEYSKRMIGGLEKIFDMSGLNNALNDVIKHAPKNESTYGLRLVSKRAEDVQEVYNLHVSAKGTDVFYIGVIESTKQLASNLIRFLQHEYN